MKMLRFGVMLVVLSCISDVTNGQADVSIIIYMCTSKEVSYTVYNGIEKGRTFIEGSRAATTNCPTVLNGVDQNFTMNYGVCNVKPTSSNNDTVLEFVIIVQESENINTIDDKRYTVICTFSESKTSIDVELKTSSSAPITYTSLKFDTDPLPKINLYFENDTDASTRVVKLGTPLLLKITLENNIPNYDIIALACTMVAATLSAERIGDFVKMIDEDSGCSALPGNFPNLTYGYIQALDSTNTEFDVPLLSALFNVFTPTLDGEQLSINDVIIRILCIVDVCVRGGSGCNEPVCDSTKRRRREADTDDAANTTRFDLHESFRVSLYGDSNVEMPDVNIGESDICMESLAFWGALLTLLALLVAAWIALCCFFIFVRRRRRRECRTKIYEDDKTSTKDSTITPVEINVVEKPMKTIPMILPRYHVADFGVETVETRKEFY